jgi:Tol biopolymer transport system component
MSTRSNRRMNLILLSTIVVSGLFFNITTAQGAPGEERILYFHEDMNKRGNGDLYIMNSDGSNSKKVSKSSRRPVHFPSVSSDGKRIAFESYRLGG